MAADRLIVDKFPEATYISNGIDAGKWDTEHFLIHPKCAFITDKKTRESFFVNGREWKKNLEQLKEKSNRINEKLNIKKIETDAIV